MNRFAIAASTLAVAALCTGGPALARDQVQIAGSSTVLPYAQIVAEDFGKTYSKFKAPVVESGGSSAGLKQFCKGVGEATIDIANSSRPIKDKEIAACAEAGVKNIMPVRFGYDGIVFATDAKSDAWALEPKDVYLALAEEIPVDGKMTANPNKTWKDVNDKLPDWKIVAYIPGEKHGTREVFEEKVLAVGCEAVGGMKAHEEAGMDEKAAEKACVKVRKDGGAVDIDGDYTETLARIQSNPEGVGVFGLSFYENNTDKLNVATMSGIAPSVETISSGEYPVSRPLFFYVKKDHIGVIPGLKEYVEFFTSEKMIGPDGPLADYGLVPLPENELEALQEEIEEGKVLSM
ncbi:PstS family phosphate ABC transporter substrate-binding protein [Methyloceanibacter caenitepidi]|uniref:Phosphate ABC transporter, periplasmic phosphate-binding protein PstS n=1 Tax=Methyloceanibacter caenitepidi TaxID=1384459 RepID=A0A0A8K0G4_9HYPH|nr:substrate-binding domain-containing protein [Methyloceanibacter caenitepidi]BAQ16291.1 phosphate ABC transporter, periplasmic phosphate-binding protein PstS [Methyloceanibacter caenitepidi]